MSAVSTMGGLAGAMQIAAGAIGNATAGFSRDAAIVASGAVPDANEVLPALIDSRQQLIYTQAAAKLMSTADEMLGTLIDIQA